MVTPTPEVVPDWVQIYEVWMNPASVIAAVALPLMRVGIRSYRKKVFKKSYLVHDAMSGLALPTLLALCLGTMAPALLGTLDHGHLFLAGLLGVVFVIGEAISPDGDEDESDTCQHAIAGRCRPTRRATDVAA